MHHPITSALPRSASFNKDLRTDSGTRQQNIREWLHSDLVTALLHAIAVAFEWLNTFLETLLNREIKSIEIPSEDLSNGVGMFVQRMAYKRDFHQVVIFFETG